LHPTLEDAIALACRVHRGQLDKSGKPYILHVLRVMLRQEEDTTRKVAALHDVVEDSEMTIADLRAAGYSEEICAAVDALTRREGESYDAMIARVEANPLALRVKIADLEDNMDPARQLPGELEVERQEKYARARARLQYLREAT
jgi:(p)ppGpp synthase/HD superfamily hydrolase